MLNFIKSFLCIYWVDHIVLIHQFVYMVYHTIWFAYIEESLQPWDKSHLIMLYEPFNVSLDLNCSNFVEDTCVYVHQWYWPVIIIIIIIYLFFLWYLCLLLVSGWWWPHRICLGVSLPLQFFEHFQDTYQLFSNCLIEFASEAIWSWTFVYWKIFLITLWISVLVTGLFIISILPGSVLV